MSQRFYIFLFMTDTTNYFYLIVAILATIALLIQTIGIFTGLDTDADFSGGNDLFDAQGFSLISLKTLTGFAFALGWAGILLRDYFDSEFVLGIVSFCVGITFMFFLAFLIKHLTALSQNKCFRIQFCVNKTADVYLSIPAHGAGFGKIQVSINGTIHEIAAMTTGEMIPTGNKVLITEVLDEHSVKVLLFQQS